MTKQASTTPATFSEGDRVEVTNDRTGNEPMAGEIVEVKKGWFRVVLDEEFEDANGKLVTEVSARESSLTMAEEGSEDEQGPEGEPGDLEGGEEEGDEETGHSKMAEALRRARVHYTKALRPDGTPTAHCGDLIAKVLLESDPLEVCSFADSICEEPQGYHEQRYAALNNGQKRMNSGNKIRAAWRKALELNDTTTIRLIAGVLGIDDDEIGGDQIEQDPESSDADFEGNHGV
jgi:hypothetical protein